MIEKLLNLLPTLDNVLIFVRSCSAMHSLACSSLSANITYKLLVCGSCTGGVAGFDLAVSVSLALPAPVPFVAEGVPGLAPIEEVVGTFEEEGCGVRGLFCATGGTGEFEVEALAAVCDPC